MKKQILVDKEMYDNLIIELRRLQDIVNNCSKHYKDYNRLKQHKLHVFVRGGYYQFFLDLPLDECKKRDDERIAKLSDLQREQELQHELKTLDIDFEDYFYIWTSAGQDIQEFVDLCLRKLPQKKRSLNDR